MSRVPIYEGDTIFLSCLEAKGFLFSHLSSSSYSHVSVCPSVYDDEGHLFIPNIHFSVFQVLPAYVPFEIGAVRKYLQEDKESCVFRRLVYGRKIKFLHVASNEYLSLPSDIEFAGTPPPTSQFATLASPEKSSNNCLFKILPSSSTSIGSTIHYGDEVVLESVLHKGYYVFCVNSSLTEGYALKPSVTKSVFEVHSHANTNNLSKTIKGGSVVRLYSTTDSAYLRAARSADSELHLHKDCEMLIKVGARKKRLSPHEMVRQPPMSGDSWWQLEKSDNPLDGTPFKFGDKCRLKHIPTQKYLAVTVSEGFYTRLKDNKITLVDGQGGQKKKFIFDFFIEEKDNETGGQLTKGCVINLRCNIDNTKYITIDRSSFEWITKHAKKGKYGSEIYKLSLGDTYHDSFGIDEVKPDDVKKIYFVMSVKKVLLKYVKKLKETSSGILLDELLETLDLGWKSLDYIQMLRNSDVLDILVEFLNLELNNELHKKVCNVLEELAKLPSVRCRKYMAKKSFLQIMYRKLGDDVGIDRVLMALVKDDNDIGKTVVSALQNYWGSNQLVNAVVMSLTSEICFSTSHKLSDSPEHECYCMQIFANRKAGFIKTLLEEHELMYELNGEKKSLYELCSCDKSPDSDDFKFLVAQLKLFSRLCRSKGQNYEFYKAIVLECVPFDTAYYVITDSNIHLLVQSGYLDVAVSTHINEEEIGCSVDDLWHCFFWKKLKNGTRPLEGANIQPKSVSDLKESGRIKIIMEVMHIKMKNYSKLCVLKKYRNEFYYQMLSFTKMLASHGFYWNIQNKPDLELASLVDILDGSDDLFDEDSDGEYNRIYRKTERYKAAPEEMKISNNVLIFQLKTKIVEILRDFFKHLMYLAVEQMVYDFASSCKSPYTSSEDFISPPNALLSENFAKKLESKEFILQSSPQERFQKYFTFQHYQYFDVTKEKGKRLVNILQDLMLYEDDELRASSAGLLFDIYNKEDILFDKAYSLYIIVKDDKFSKLLLYAAYQPDCRHLYYLRQGTGDQSVADFLDEIARSMIVAKDETEMKSSVQNVIFSSIFSSIMSYVLEFCITKDHRQEYLLQKACYCLQMMCRGQEEIQAKIFQNFDDLLKAKIAISSVAHLLTETLTNNTTLCLQLTGDTIRQLYTLATTDDNPEYLEYFTTLETVMKPFKSVNVPSVLKVHQCLISQLFTETRKNVFGDIMETESGAKRIEILRTSSDDNIQLLKLLNITNLLATCSEGQQQKFAEDLCRDIFSQDELVRIIADSNIPVERKMPFAYLLMEIYFVIEGDIFVSLTQLCIDHVFWEHVSVCSQWMLSLPETIKDDDERENIKYYLKKIFGYHTSWMELCNVDKEIRTVCCILFYFTKGIGPLLRAICDELSAYKENMISRREYIKMIFSCGNSLKMLESNISGFITEQNERVFLSTRDQAEFWKSCLNSITSVLPDSAVTYSTFDYSTKYFVSEEMSEYRASVKSEIETNQQFQQFIANYKILFEWKTDKDEDFGQLLPQGPSFTSLVKLFNDVQIFVEEKNTKKTYKIMTLLTMLKVMFRQLSHHLTINNRVILNCTLAMTLKVLIGILLNVNDEQFKPFQNALIGMKFFEETLLHLSNPDDDIAVHVMSFLAVLILNGNQAAQNKLYDLISEDTNFFMRAHKLISKKVSPHSSNRIKFAIAEKYTGTSLEEEPASDSRKLSNLSNMISVDEDGDDAAPLLEVNYKGRKMSLLPKLSAFIEDVDVVVIHDDDQCDQDVSTSIYKDEFSEDPTNFRTGVVLDLVSAMCDGQNKKMQQIVRGQHHSTSSFDIVSEITVLMQTLVEVPVMSDVPIIIKAIQALIEMCAGNFENQQVALDGQVIDSINIILKHNLKSTDGIRMQCKAIELLEVLFEETDANYALVIKTISKDLKTDHVIEYIKNMYEHYKQKDENYDEVMERNMYRAYHVLRGMADNAGMNFTEYVGMSESEIESEPWKLLVANTHSVEINYITKEKELLTRVYFPFESSRELSEDEKYKLQNEINRDTPEDKVKDLLNWTDSVWKKDKHKKMLNKYRIVNVLFFAPNIRHFLFMILTIILNLLVLIFFRIPKFVDGCISNSSTPVNWTFYRIPEPAECWSTYQYILIYILGVPHLILTVWSVLRYFVEEAPNFNFEIPFFQRSWYDYLPSWLSRRFHKKFPVVINPVLKSQCFDIYFFSPGPISQIFLLLCSLLGLLTYGYFYCLCLPYILGKIDVVQHVVKAVIGKAKQIVFVSLLILSLMFVYAVFAFAFMSGFFDLSENLYCRTLLECFITVTREGLLDTLGASLPVTYEGQRGVNRFDIYFWRSLVDLSFYIIITLISLNVITAILVDRFSELRAKRDAALQDQRDVCFVCGIPNDRFEREGLGFRHHYKYEHNLYNLIYYALYIKSKCLQDHNAIEKYVNEMMDKKDITFYPLRKAKVLGGALT